MMPCLSNLEWRSLLIFHNEKIIFPLFHFRSTIFARRFRDVCEHSYANVLISFDEQLPQVDSVFNNLCLRRPSMHYEINEQYTFCIPEHTSYHYFSWLKDRQPRYFSECTTYS